MIEGDRVRLRAVGREDLPRFITWLNDPEVRQNLTIYLPLSMIQEEKWFDDIMTHPFEEHPLTIEVKTPEGWTPIGNTTFFNLDWHSRCTEIGIFIGEKRFWRLGYGCEVMRLMLDHGFKNLNLNRIFLRVFDTNKRGISAYEHAGFIHEGRMRQAHFLEGHYVDVLYMSVLRSEWEGKIKHD